jgi:hypothetical protein
VVNASLSRPTKKASLATTRPLGRTRSPARDTASVMRVPNEVAVPRSSKAAYSSALDIVRTALGSGNGRPVSRGDPVT